MLLVVFFCFNWHAGVSLTGPNVHFYVSHIKEREGERMETDVRRSPGAEVTLQTRRTVCSSFHLSLSRRSLSPFSCLVPSLPIPLPSPPRHRLFTHPCLPLFMWLHLSAIIISLSLCLLLARLPFPHQKTSPLSFLSFMSLTSRLTALFTDSEDEAFYLKVCVSVCMPAPVCMCDRACVPYIGQPQLLLGAVKWFESINKAATLSSNFPAISYKSQSCKS